MSDNDTKRMYFWEFKFTFGDGHSDTQGILSKDAAGAWVQAGVVGSQRTTALRKAELLDCFSVEVSLEQRNST